MEKTISLNNFLLLIILCAPLYLIKVSVFGLPSNVFELLMLLGTLLTIFQQKNIFFKKMLAIPKTLFFSLVLIFFGLLLSTFSNDNLPVAFGIIKGWFIVPALFSFALYAKFDSTEDLTKIFKAVYSSTILVGIVALCYKVFGITTYDDRLSAFYLSPNHLAMYLAPGFFLGLYFLLKSFQKKLFRQTLLHLFLLALIVVPLYFTYSYGAWLAISISLLSLSLLLISDKKWLTILFALLFVGLFLLFVSQKDSSKFNTSLSSRSSLASRLTIWQVAIQLVHDKPIVGIGPGNFQTAYLSLQKNYPPYLEWAVPQPHNIFLAFWLQTGLFGLVGFLTLLIFVFKTLWQIIKNKKNAALAAPLLGFFLYTALHGFIDTTYWKNDLAFLFWICVTLSFSLYHLPPRYRDHEKNTLQS